MLGHVDPKWIVFIITAIICAMLVFLAFDLPVVPLPENE